VAIVGGGFGGLAAAKALRRADAEVTLVDRMSHHLFQPLLYQAAAGALSEGQIAAPIRVLLKRQRNVGVLMAEVTDLDVERHEIILDTGERVDYDSLILACGAETSYFGHDEWKGVSCGLKTLADAVELRGRIFGALEQAERANSAARDEWLTFVVVGGGPTGVETSGALAILTRALRRDFSRIDTTAARVILIDAGERVVPAFSERLSAKAAQELNSLGVTVREGLQATAIDEGG
jgi:NADH dehydrogenase